MFLLAIESSCDETSVALVYHPNALQNKPFADDNYFLWLNQTVVIGSQISSQVAVHAKYGGVIPEIGAREHTKAFHPLLTSLLSQAMVHPLLKTKNIKTPMEVLKHVETIAVTTHPGLASALRVGYEAAQSLQFFAEHEFKKSIKVLKINHLHGHVASSFYQQKQLENTLEFEHKKEDENKTIFPHVHLLVSGGNSQLIVMESSNTWHIIGQTLDDAAGECFDKSGRMLGLPYPAGVLVSRIAGMALDNPCNFPVSMIKNPGFDMSFSGLKTAVRYNVQRQNISDFLFEKPLSDNKIQQLTSQTFSQNDEKLTYIYSVCVSLQTVIIQQLTGQMNKVIKKIKPVSIGVSGGVSANPLLRSQVLAIANKNNIPSSQVFLPHTSLTGDNAVMIALAGLGVGEV